MRSTRPVFELPNVSPKLAGWLAAEGIITDDDLERAGAVGAYLLLARAGRPVDPAVAVRLQGAIEDRAWSAMSALERAAVREAAARAARGPVRWPVVAGVALMAVLGAIWAANPGGWRFLDHVNLVMHEAGHVLFMPFGTTWHLLGGSLFQVIVPLVFAASFLRRGLMSSALFPLFWAAESLWNASVYVGDASARLLPLITNDIDTHDWWQLLSAAGRLEWDRPLSALVWAAGIAVWLGTLWLGLVASNALPARWRARLARS